MAQTSTYLVELAAPASGWHELQQMTARARAGAEELSAEGAAVRFLRSVYVPEDERCFFLYDSDCAETVGRAGVRADLEILGIDAALGGRNQTGQEGA